MPGALHDLRDAFCAAVGAVGARAQVVHDGFTLAATIESIVREHDPEGARVLFEPFLEAEALGVARGLHARGVRLVEVEQARDADPGSFAVGLNKAALGVADTGTLLFGGAAGGWGLVSALPWVHVAVVDVADLYADVDAGFDRFLELQGRGSDWVWITGPSKTADIAHTLVTGIHGPNRLEVLVVDEAGGARG